MMLQNSHVALSPWCGLYCYLNTLSCSGLRKPAQSKQSERTRDRERKILTKLLARLLLSFPLPSILLGGNSDDILSFSQYKSTKVAHNDSYPVRLYMARAPTPQLSLVDKFRVLRRGQGDTSTGEKNAPPS